MRTWLSAVAVCLLASACASGGASLRDDATGILDEAQVRALYDDGMSELMRGNYEEALKRFERASRAPAGVTWAVLAQLRAADALFLNGEYAQAAEEYRIFTEEHPDDPNVDYARYMLVRARDELLPSDWFLRPPSYENDRAALRAALAAAEAFVRQYPSSRFFPQVRAIYRRLQEQELRFQLYVADFYRRRGKWRAVALRLLEARKRFPRRTHSPEFLVDLAEALERAGQLDEARRVWGELAREFDDTRTGRLARRHLDRLGVDSSPPDSKAPRGTDGVGGGKVPPAGAGRPDRVPGGGGTAAGHVAPDGARERPVGGTEPKGRPQPRRPETTP